MVSLVSSHISPPVRELSSRHAGQTSFLVFEKARETGKGNKSSENLLDILQKISTFKE